MAKFNGKFRQYLMSLAPMIEKWRWALVVVIGLALFWAELYEFIQLKFLNQPLHIGEVFLYAVLLICTGLFLELFVRSNKAYKQSLKILEYKHKLSLDLALYGEQESLINRLVELPKTIAKVDESYLLMSNPTNGHFEIAGHWSGNGRSEASKWDPTLPCSTCLEKTTSKNTFHQCQGANIASSASIYSLCVTSDDYPTAILKFKLVQEFQLSPEEEGIFKNLGDEIAVAIQVSEDRRRLLEIQSANVAMAERRIMSAYVHDQLGQNLGYLQLKLDRLSNEEGMIRSDVARKEINHLRDVANESYEIVRDFLKKLQPETIPNLTNLLKEHATTVSRTAKFSLNFKSTGSPVQIISNAQNTILYTFREILNNVEKHSNAENVDVLLTWGESFLDISVADNGVGFDPNLIKKDSHFGLEIMKERIASLKGQFLMNSSADLGTVISISVPIK